MKDTEDYREYLMNGCKKSQGVAYTRWIEVLKQESGKTEIPRTISRLYFNNWSVGQILQLMPREAEIKIQWTTSSGMQAENTIANWSELSIFLEKNPGVIVHFSV